MKKLILLIIIFLPIALFAESYDDMARTLLIKIPARYKTQAIAVMPFTSVQEEFKSDASIATDEMTKALINAGAVVSERSQIDKLIREQELQQIGIVSNKEAGEIGQGLGARYVVVGSVTKIDKYGESGNIGLKINVRLVQSSNYRVIAAASGEAAAGDASARYRRKAPRRAAAYPQFLEIFGGATAFKYDGTYSNFSDQNDNTFPGLLFGVRLIRENTGFYTNGWEFLVSTRKFKDDSLNNRITVFQLSWIPTIRIPLWVYLPTLPDYTSIHLGYSFGFGVDNVDYNTAGSKSSSKGFGVCSSAILGLRIGISDSISIFGDVRYSPHFMNQFIRTADIANDDVGISEELTGPSAYFGISLTP